jgi:hypothetical protein
MADKAKVVAQMRIFPLMPRNFSSQSSIDAALRVARRDLMRRLKAKLGQTAFSRRAKEAFAKALKIETKAASLVVTVNHPGFSPLVDGRRRKQMTWLKKARRPIPIITETGELIFRSAHAGSLTWTNGPMTGPNVGKKRGWRHPGRDPEDFVDRAKEDAREFLRGKLTQEFMKELRKSFAKKRR